MISPAMKHFIKSPFRSIGFDLIKRRPYPLEFLRSYGINTVLDVGAHEGGFANEVRMVLPDAMLHSFEPVRQTFEGLERNLARDPKFKAWKFAVGATEGQSEIGVNSQSASSSFIPPGTLSQRFPSSNICERQLVDVITLDNWSESQQLRTPLLLKVDVQGFEKEVLAGAKRLLADIAVVILEVSFEQVYDNQPLFGEIYDTMRSNNFEFKGLYDSWFDALTARQIQSNAIFENKMLAT